MGWIEFAAAFTVFFLTHSLPIRPPLRPRLQAALGRAGFTLVYSALSLAMLAWLIGAAGRAPFVPLWPQAPWQNHVVIAAMLPVSLLLTLAIGRPNPLSFGGAQNDLFDRARPGVVRWLRHPLLTALAIWAGVHLLANGDLAHVILFGTFAVFAALGGRLIDRRCQREMGPAWAELSAQIAATPLLPQPLSWAGLIARLVAGIALYIGLIWAHPLLFGVSPLP